MAFENVTGQSFVDAFRTGIIEPLNLKRTFYNPPTSDISIIRADPEGVNTFELDLGILDP